MPTFPVRRLGSSGIVCDIASSDLDSAAIFNKGKNVRFRNGGVVRGPVARTVSPLDFEPGHVLTIPPSATGFDEIVSVSTDFSTFRRINGRALEDLTPPGQIGIEGPQAITSGILGGISYVNRETHRPVYKRARDNTYQDLASWPANWTTRVLRPYRDSLIALGVTQDGQFYPTKVVFSNPVLTDQIPTDWTAKAENLAGESTSNSMQHLIVDGLELRESFIIYTTASIWRMDWVGGDVLYSWSKIWDERGAIGPNCVAQVGGLHYVFDRTDIWMHDGSSEQSIADGVVKDHVFRTLDYNRAHLCFVSYDPKLSEIRFNYPSKADDAAYVNPTTGCNRAAIYNYANKTWTFDDVPNVTAATRAAVLTGRIFDDPDTIDVTFDQTGGLFDSTDGDDDRHSLYVSRAFPEAGLSASRLYGYDLLTGGRMPIAPEPECLQTSYVERTGIDLDELGKNLTQMVRLQAIWPQAYIDKPQDSFWQFGANDLVTIAPEWSERTTWDPNTESKIYIAETGKYLAYRFECGGEGDFRLTGFDVQLNIRGRR